MRQIQWLGQTRYQEIDPQTGANIGSPMTQAEYDARTGLQPVPRARAVFLPGAIDLQRSTGCQSLWVAINNAQLAYDQLLQTLAALRQTSVQPYALQVMQNAIANALSNLTQLKTLATQIGCNNAVQLSKRVTVLQG